MVDQISPNYVIIRVRDCRLERRFPIVDILFRPINYVNIIMPYKVQNCLNTFNILLLLSHTSQLKRGHLFGPKHFHNSFKTPAFLHTQIANQTAFIRFIVKVNPTIVMQLQFIRTKTELVYIDRRRTSVNENNM